MGWEQVPNTTSYNIRNMAAGWFPGKTYNDIPGALDGSEAIGSPDCNYAIWNDGALRKIFGYDNVNTSALNGGASVTSIYYSTVLDSWLTTVGNKVYSGADGATPTDRTGAVVITAGNNVKWSDYIFSTTVKLAIATNGVDVPFKWTGAGNVAALAGSPPSGRWSATWQNSFWLGNTSAAPSTLYFSNLGDPEVWTAGDNYNFDAPIRGLQPLGDKLVVFMDDHIGILQGTNNRLLTKVERYITNIGCSGGHTISPVKIDGRDALIFHSGDGFYIFDGSTKATKISSCIQNKYTGSSDIEKWNNSKFNIAWGTYIPSFGWYMVGLASGADTTNLFGLIIDLTRPITTAEGLVFPHWPMENLPKAMNCIATNPAIDINSSIIFGSTDGFNYKFSTSIFNQNGTSYSSEWKSKTFDMTANTLVQEINVLSESQSTSTTLDVYVDGDIGTDDGVLGTADFSQVEDTLDVDFMVGSSVLASGGTAFKNLETGNFGRFLSFKVANTIVDQPMIVNMVHCVLTNISIDSNKGN